MTKTRALVALTLLALLAGSAFAWERELKEARQTKESGRYFKAVRNLDPSDDKAFKKLLWYLSPDFNPSVWCPEDWHIRKAAIEALAGAKGSRIDELESKLAKGKPMVQEGIDITKIEWQGH